MVADGIRPDVRDGRSFQIASPTDEKIMGQDPDHMLRTQTTQAALPASADSQKQLVDEEESKQNFNAEASEK